ncbi:MAG: hypothetical protein LUD68_08595 [Rikenellaceae bacterium]|nr:hypothetical protein [Rikenellaceae bacterium]
MGSTEAKLYKCAVAALQQRIVGYRLTEHKKVYFFEQGESRLKEEMILQKETGPDLAAIQFVLNHLAPQRWNAKPEEKNLSESRSKATSRKPDLSRLSDVALQELERLCAD